MGPHLSAVVHFGAYYWAYMGDRRSAATKGLENRWSAREPDRHEHSVVWECSCMCVVILCAMYKKECY